jgi:hypothetical protein
MARLFAKAARSFRPMTTDVLLGAAAAALSMSASTDGSLPSNGAVFTDRIRCRFLAGNPHPFNNQFWSTAASSLRASPVCCRWGARRLQHSPAELARKLARDSPNILPIPVCIVGGAMVSAAATWPSKQECQALARRSFSPETSSRLVVCEPTPVLCKSLILWCARQDSNLRPPGS